MYYNNYQNNPWAVQYQPPQSQQQPQNNSGLIWVQGESGAKSYLVAPSQTVLLMDSENSKFYLKSTDASGMPLPLRIFEYNEVGTPQNTQNTSKSDESINLDNFVTKDELREELAKLSGKKLKKGSDDNAE